MEIASICQGSTQGPCSDICEHSRACKAFSGPQDRLLAAQVPFGGNSHPLGQGEELEDPC